MDLSKLKLTSEKAIRASADTFVAFIDATQFGGVPLLSVSWILFKAYYASTLEYRQELVIEFLEVFNENKEAFTKVVVSSPSFQNSFVKILSEYLITNSEKKRRILKNVFIGNAIANDEFPLERMIAVTSQLIEKDIEVFRDVDLTRSDLNYRIYKGKASDEQIASIYNLLSLGLLIVPGATRMVKDGIGEQFVLSTPFGVLYKEYLIEEKTYKQKNKITAEKIIKEDSCV